MAEPLISVIIAARDAGHILSRAIASALKQSWRNIELIVVDDASTDDTGKVVASFDDPRLILLHNDENRHISVSTNRGMAAAHGDFIAILDSDDAWYPDKLKKQMAWMEAHPETGACFTWVNVVDENGHPTRVPWGLVATNEEQHAECDGARRRSEIRKMRRKEGV